MELDQVLEAALAAEPEERARLLRNLLESGGYWPTRPFLALLDGAVELLFQLPTGVEKFSFACPNEELQILMRAFSNCFIA